MKFAMALLLGLLFCLITTPAFSQLQLNKVKYKGLALFDSLPEFPGGDTALANYCNNNFVKPNTVDSCLLTGTLYISFYIESSGHVMTPEKITATIESTLEKAPGYISQCHNPTIKNLTIWAEELVKNMPRWAPAFSKYGSPKRCLVTLPIRFGY